MDAGAAGLLGVRPSHRRAPDPPDNGAAGVLGREAEAGITKPGGIHALRHAFATHLPEAGRDLHTVQRLLGHRHVTTTMRYFHLSQGRVLATPSPVDLPEPPAG